MQQFRRLELIADNTRFLVLAEPGTFPNLAAFFLARMTRRPGDDWLAESVASRAWGREHIKLTASPPAKGRVAAPPAGFPPPWRGPSNMQRADVGRPAIKKDTPH